MTNGRSGLVVGTGDYVYDVISPWGVLPTGMTLGIVSHVKRLAEFIFEHFLQAEDFAKFIFARLKARHLRAHTVGRAGISKLIFFEFLGGIAGNGDGDIRLSSSSTPTGTSSRAGATAACAMPTASTSRRTTTSSSVTVTSTRS